MVVFTCNHCGESLQKPRVEKHYNFTCRLEKFLTCVDCFKDFRGNEYNTHIKCITEEERYSGKDFVQKVKKGEVKQESWMEMIKSIIQQEHNLTHNYKSLLDTISHYNNVPRKRVKFINFIKSSTGGRTNSSDIEAVWNIIEKYKMQNISSKENNTENENNKDKIGDISDFVEIKHKKRKVNDEKNIDYMDNMNGFSPKKRKRNSTNGCNEIVDVLNDTHNFVQETKFSFSDNIMEILTIRQTISKKKLCKKLSKKYQNLTGMSITLEKIERKVNKKLEKNSNLIIENDCITLLK